MSTTLTETISAPQAPDIGYHPDEAKWRARTAQRLAQDPKLRSVPLPEGFPAKVEGPIVWEGKDWTDESQFVYRLSTAELKEINEALAHFKGLGVKKGYISKETFPLPTLGPKLYDLARELYEGRGFFVLRTIPVDEYSREDLVIVYAGISSHVGSDRGKQDSKNSVILHIKDLSPKHAKGASGIGYSAHTSDRQTFHTDQGDLISLLTLETAVEGGISKLASSSRVYNEIAATRPDLIHTLSEPWPIDRFGADPAYVMRPVLWNVDGNIIIQYTRRQFTGYSAQVRSPNIPPLTEAQAEALDTLQFTAEKFAYNMTLQKGDIQYISSLGLLHAREGFRDEEDHTRHLIRLWLRNTELAWKMPDILKPYWDRMYSLGPDQQEFPLEAELRTKHSGGLPPGAK
ncbi:Clavaminate synthase-like protein [Hymenopellis radicata]|nr:Clavaminate synthase-like protein [Hymenopellis radicata]